MDALIIFSFLFPSQASTKAQYNFSNCARSMKANWQKLQCTAILFKEVVSSLLGHLKKEPSLLAFFTCVRFHAVLGCLDQMTTSRVTSLMYAVAWSCPITGKQHVSSRHWNVTILGLELYQHHITHFWRKVSIKQYCGTVHKTADCQAFTQCILSYRMRSLLSISQ